MTHWPDTRLCTLLDIEHPIIQAPMAGATTPEMASVVSNAGGLGSLGCAIMKPEAVLSSVSKTRNLSNRALNLNFFCHESPVLNAGLSVAAQERLQPWFDDMNIEHMPDAIEGHFPFDAEMCQIVIEASPKVVSFHFGLPDTKLVKRIKDAGIKVLSSATSVAEAQWLQTHGADAVICTARQHPAGCEHQADGQRREATSDKRDPARIGCAVHDASDHTRNHAGRPADAHQGDDRTAQPSGLPAEQLDKQHVRPRCSLRDGIHGAQLLAGHVVSRVDQEAMHVGQR